jgi:hypothetical protein
MLHLKEIRIGDFFELPSSLEEERKKIGDVTKIDQKHVLVSGKWLGIERLIPINITEEILLHAGFTQFDWLRESSVFECHYFKCALDNNGVNLFCDNLKNLKPVKHLHELQNLYFDLTGEELEVNMHYLKTLNTAIV